MKTHEQFAEFEIAGQIESTTSHPGFEGYRTWTVRVRRYVVLTVYFSDDLIKSHSIHIGQFIHAKGSIQRPLGIDSEIIFDVSEVLS